MQDDDGIRNIPRLIREKEIAIENWNAAIEAAAKVAYSKGYNIIGTDAIAISSEIRKLKK
jgi:predicted nuclease with RNAse H fold